MLNLTPNHPIMQHKAKVDDARERAAREAREARGRRAAQYMANEPQGDDVSPMDAFNATPHCDRSDGPLRIQASGII